MQRKMFLRTVLSVSLVVSLIMAFAIPAAQAEGKFPNRPLTMVCPYGAGGGTDAVARMIAALMEQDLGQPVNVVNRTGGGGAVGFTAGATAAPDGYTITLASGDIAMLHWMGTTQVTPKEYRAVGQCNFDPASVNVRADAPWKTLKELQEYAKANPGKLKASGTGKGGCWDIARAGWLLTAGLSPDAILWGPKQRGCFHSSGHGGARHPDVYVQPGGSPRHDRSQEGQIPWRHGGQAASHLPECPHAQRTGYQLDLRRVERGPGP